jgi:hypothetical protein
VRPRFRGLPPPLWSLTALVALAVAFAWPMGGGALGELSNYALVKALAAGTPTIDRTRFEVGDLTAGDLTTFRGHVYSNKPPGFAFATLPAYGVLRVLGVRTSGDPAHALWALRLWSVVLPGLLLLVIARGLAERISPGHGAATAVALGAGTLVLPFAASLYSHVLSAFLVLGAFALLWREREGPPRLGLVAAAGLVAGFAVTTEYPTALAALGFGLYAILREPRIARAGAYCAGVMVGVAPLLAYNRWAFGSVTHLAYFGDEVTSGTFSSRLHPSMINGLFTFFAMPGLLVLAPVLACGIVGLALLFAQGKRAEAVAIGLVAAAYTIYNTTLPGLEFDAFLAGPRYLVPIVPLLALPIALTFRRWPLTTAALGLVSAILMSVMSASRVPAGTDPRWFHALAERNFPETAASVVGVTGWYAIFPFFLALACAIACATFAMRGIPLAPWDGPLAGLAVITWAAAAAFAPSTITGHAADYSAYFPIALVLLGFAATVLVARAASRSRQPKVGGSVSASST